MPFSTPILRLCLLGALPWILALTGCSEAPPPTIVPPAVPVSDLGRSETAAVAIEGILLEAFVRPLSEGTPGTARSSLLDEGFRGVGFAEGRGSTAGPLDVQWLLGSEEEAASPAAFLESIADLARLSQTERVEAELIRFELDPERPRATGLARIRWAGIEAERRIDLTLFAEFEFQKPIDAWKLATFLPADPGSHVDGAGLRLVGPKAPLLQDATESVGLTFGTSQENREFIQTFIDRHITLALGGISAVDHNADGLMDLIATRAEEASLVFLNDGDSGFVPEPLPVARQADRPAFILSVDLDGDGLDELVASQVTDFEGDLAFGGLWTRSLPEGQQTGDSPAPWRHVPRAFALPNPVGMRRLAAQTAVPIDVEGDGDLDLFIAVYGNAASRGERYNSVEAHDGAQNYLLINQGGLQFTEEGAERGLSGTAYTYIALGFDVDHDGDTDLFEGNDFGPNILWRNDGGQFTSDPGFGLNGVSAFTMGAALADLEADGTLSLIHI